MHPHPDSAIIVPETSKDKICRNEKTEGRNHYMPRIAEIFN